MPRAKNFLYQVENKDIKFCSTESLSEVGAWNMLYTSYPELKSLSIKQLKKQGYAIHRYAVK